MDKNDSLKISSGIGTVISTVDGPSSINFNFVINSDSDIKKGQFVEVQMLSGTLMARVDEVVKANRYFERAESVSEFSKNNVLAEDVFPVKRWEYFIAMAQIIGVYKDGIIKRVVSPLSPGNVVYLAKKEMVIKFLGLNMENGLNLGTVAYQDIDAKIDMTRLLQKHFAILAMSGAGKSYLTSVILEELVDRDKQQGSVAVVIADPHGEYSSFGSDPKYVNKVKVINGSDIRLPVDSLGVSQVSSFFSSMKEVHEHVLQKALGKVREAFKEKGGYDIDNIISTVSSDESARDSVKDLLTLLLGNLKRMKLFAKEQYPAFKDIKQGKVLVLDFGDIFDTRKRQIIVSSIASRMFDSRRSGKIPPFLFVVEEAHNFAPEKVRKEYAISKSIIEKIAREGRKFNACLCLVTQRPVHLSTTALSQCNTHIILRVTNPYDLDHIGKTSEGLTSNVVRTIPSLQTGDAIIVGAAVNHPVFITVRERKSKESVHSTTLEDACIEFSDKKDKDDKDVEAFL
ncbi:MAG: ATP-binding protein [DPANN group archaeon]|nr:ATP-binding protein [DPANN group archaeon]